MTQSRRPPPPWLTLAHDRPRGKPQAFLHAHLKFVLNREYLHCMRPRPHSLTSSDQSPALGPSSGPWDWPTCAHLATAVREVLVSGALRGLRQAPVVLARHLAAQLGEHCLHGVGAVPVAEGGEVARVHLRPAHSAPQEQPHTARHPVDHKYQGLRRLCFVRRHTPNP